jgi:hypothetical protein
MQHLLFVEKALRTSAIARQNGRRLGQAERGYPLSTKGSTVGVQAGLLTLGSSY